MLSWLIVQLWKWFQKFAKQVRINENLKQRCIILLQREQQDAEYEASIKMDRAKEQARLHAAQGTTIYVALSQHALFVLQTR